MHGFIKVLLLAPALGAFAAPFERRQKEVDNVERVAGHSFTFIALDLLSASQSYDKHIQGDAIQLRLDVFPSEEACGYANVTIDGKFLPSTTDGGLLKGKGSLTTERKTTIAASWTFQCIKVNGQPDSQFLEFVVNSVDGRAVQETGFSTLFRQTGDTEIININNDLEVSVEVAANPDSERLRLLGEEDRHSRNGHETIHDIEHELAELDWLMAQLHELKYLIAEKKLAISQHVSDHYKEDIKDCDSLKCVVKAIARKAKHTAHMVYGKLAGDSLHGHFHGSEHPHGEKSGSTSPKKCNGTRSGKGDHTGLPPHSEKSHKFLPICRLPSHHGRPHYETPHDEHLEDKVDHHGNPHHRHEAEQFSNYEHVHHGADNEAFPYPPHHGNEGPDGHGSAECRFCHRGHSGEHADDFNDEQDPLFESPDNKGHHDHKEDLRSHIPPRFPPHGPPPHGPPHPGDGPPPFGPHEHNHHGPPHIAKVFFFLKFGIIGFLASILCVDLYRRKCSPSKKADRKARRDRRRAYRRIVHKDAITRLLARISCDSSDDEDDLDEKTEQEGASTVADEITQLVNAVEVVDEIVSAEERCSNSVPIGSPRDFDLSSHAGDDDELLPAYEDNDGSEMGSIIADGFLYTPGSSNYSPSQSVTDSVSDVLGPDTKS